MSEILEAGRYRARAREWSIWAASTGTMQIGVLFDLLDMPGQRITWYGFFTDKALPDTVKALRTMGWQGSDPSELGDNGGGLDANEVSLVVEHEQDQQKKTRARVRWVNPSGGLGLKPPLAGNDLKAFGAQLRGKILALDPSRASQHAAARPQAPARPPAPPQRRPEPPPVDDGDVPF
jgi:hypothetical protein